MRSLEAGGLVYWARALGCFLVVFWWSERPLGLLFGVVGARISFLFGGLLVELSIAKHIKISSVKFQN